MESLIKTYGYIAVLVGTFLEGETVLVLGGFAAHQGYLKLPWVILAAFVGGLCGDQLFFFLGRWRGQSILAINPSWKVRADKVHKLMVAHNTALMLGFRFLYGLRTITPFVFGTSGVPTRLFVLLNAVGAVVWAVAVGAGGYLFGHALEAIIGDIEHYERLILVTIVIIGIVIWSIYLRRRKFKKDNPIESSQTDRLS